MKSVLTGCIAMFILCNISLAQSMHQDHQAPTAPQHEHAFDWHGEPVQDPWYWLRDKDSPPVLDYLQAENAYTRSMTEGLAPFTDTLYQEMLGRLQQTDMDVPVRRGAWFYYSRTAAGQQYPIRCRRPASTAMSYDERAPEQVLLDLNEMAQGRAFISLGFMQVSDDGAWLVYAIDETGYRQYKLYRKSLASGKVEGPLAERVTRAQWATDNAMVFFTTEHPISKRSDSLWRLRSGGKPELIHEEKDELFRVDLGRSKDLKYLVLEVASADTWESSMLDASKPDGSFKLVLPREKGHKYEVEHRDGLLYIRTNREAKDFRIVTAPMDQPLRWTPFVAHRHGVLIQGVEIFQDYLVVAEKQNGLSRFRIHDFRQGRWLELPFSETTYAASPMNTPEYNSSAFRYAFQSLVTPSSVFDFDMTSGKSSLLKQQAVLGGYDASKYSSERLWITARDGVKVPVSIAYRKDRARDGQAPLWLSGYGAYGYGSQASFGSWRLSLLDRGFAFASAHVRGGDEMGEAWHDDGKLMKKMNTFTDFIDTAEQLIRSNWTSAAGLVIEGGSAGGLLMGVVTNLRPGLFKAVHAAVPFVDVMNTMMDASLPLTVGEYLEWGNPNEKPAFDYMRAYSPYDNLRKQAYPAILVTTSYNDSQVMYWEPTKYVAKLRTLKTDRNALLLKCKMDPAGHGGASGRYDALKDKAFEMAWMMQQVGITQ